MFFFNASISKSMAYFHFLSNNDLDTEEAMVVVFRFVRKVLWVGENFSKDKKLDRG